MTEATTQQQQRALNSVSTTILFTQLSAGLNLGQFYPSKEFLDICGSIVGCQTTGEDSHLSLGARVVNFLLYVGQSCKIIKTASLSICQDCLHSEALAVTSKALPRVLSLQVQQEAKQDTGSPGQVDLPSARDESLGIPCHLSGPQFPHL